MRCPRRAQQVLGDHARQHMHAEDEPVEDREGCGDRAAQRAGTGLKHAGRDPDGGAGEQNAGG